MTKEGLLTTKTDFLEFCSISCNRINQGISVLTPENVVFAAGNFVGLFDNLKRNDANQLNPGLSGLKTFKGHSKKITCLISLRSACQEWVLTGSADSTCILWKVVDGGKNLEIIQTLVGHESGVVACAAMVQNETLLLASSDSSNTIMIWEQRNGSIELAQKINLSPHHCMSLGFASLPNSDTPILFCGGTDMKFSLYVRQEETFKKILALSGHTDWIRSITIATFTDSHDEKYGFQEGDLMIATASQDKYIRIWKISETGQSNALLPSALDSQMLDAMNNLQGTQLSTKAHLVNVNLKKYTVMLDAILLGHDDWVLSVNWEPKRMNADPNGNEVLHQPMSLVSASADKSILVWNPDLHSESWIPKHRVGEVGGTTLGFYGGAFSTDGQTLFSNGYNGAIHIWTLNNEQGLWEPSLSLTGHSKAVQDCAWDPTGSYLLSTSLDQTSRIFAPWARNENTWHEISRSQIHGYNLHCCSFFGKYGYVSGADEKVIRVFEAPKNFAKTLENITGVKESAQVLDNRPAGANLPALGLSNKAVFEGDGAPATLDSRLSAYTAGALSSALTTAHTQPPFEEDLLQNTLWPEIEKLYGHGYEIMALATSPDGTIFSSSCKASKEEYASIRLWSTKDWTLLCTPLSYHSLTVTCMAFSRSNKYLLSAGRDRSWALFDISSVEDQVNPSWSLKQACPKAHARIIWGCCFTPDDKAFVTCSRDKMIHIWGTKSDSLFECISTIKMEESVTAIDVLDILVNDCYVLAAGMENGAIVVYYLTINDVNEVVIQETVPIPVKDTHSMTVKSVKWRPRRDENSKSLQLASCSEDGSLRLFNI